MFLDLPNVTPPMLIKYRHMYEIKLYNSSEIPEFEKNDLLYDISECYRLMLEASADFGKDGNEHSGFQEVLVFESSVSSTSPPTVF